jgi:hypothetical protein
MHGTLHLVDLAGSERLAKSNATGDTHTYKINVSYMCVLILEFLCPHPTIYMCAQVSGSRSRRLYMCPHFITSVRMLLYVCPLTTTCVRMLLYVCDHTAIYMRAQVSG